MYKHIYHIPAYNVVLWTNNNMLVINSIYGYTYLYLPKKYYYDINTKLNTISLMFTNIQVYRGVMRHLQNALKFVNRVYLARLRVRGLGYRVRKFCTHLYRFYFTKTNYIYVHIPQGLILRLRKRRMILISNNYSKLRLLFVHILLLKISGPYNKRGFVYPRRILFLKPGKKVN